MKKNSSNSFSTPITVFRERRLPERATLAGYSALIDAFNLNVPIPRKLSAIGTSHKILDIAGWRILTPRHAPQATLEGHLTFALKYEGLDLVILKKLFKTVDKELITTLISSTPTGAYSRRIWFLFEWLTGQKLDLPQAERGHYVNIVNPEQQYAVEGVNVTRHRVRNNLPGSPAFCPLVYRTPTLDKLIARDLSSQARAIIADVPSDVMARAASFLLLKDSQSSWAIEGENTPQDRIQRWGRAIGEAGHHPLDLDEFIRLQRMVIGNSRFINLGLRTEGGFVGEHDRDAGMPIPVHISSCFSDLPALVDGLVSFEKNSKQLDPVIAAASLAFGFVYIHPFEDGNGRIHRYLIHHVLAERGFSPTGVVFPVSYVILENICEYRRVLEDYSVRLLPVVSWEPTDKGNVRVLNDTADFYRFFDATKHAEFLYRCVQKTIEEDLPRETDYLRRYDLFRAGVETIVDMPNRTINLLFRFLRQNDGRILKRASKKEFSKLAKTEIVQLERIFEDAFGDLDQSMDKK